jgi:hypothetical protein
MSTISPAFRPAALRFMEITYHCDLTRADGGIIPFGVLADMSVEGVYGLGLVARRALSEMEMEKIGELMRADFAAPFSYLLGVFNSVYKDGAPAAAFAALAAEHTHSLRFHRLADAAIKLPRPIITNADARILWVKDQLSSYGNSAYWKLFGEHVPAVVDKGLIDEARELDHAA